MKYEFVDAQEMHKLHPDTFEVPTQNELDNIQIGQHVKVSCNNERFWTKVKKIKGDQITATVSNDLFMSGNEKLTFGKPIKFEKKNIYSIFYE